MAKVYYPFSREIYGPLKGVVDFYYHKGQLCARGYPERCRQPHTPGAMQNWDAQRAKWAALRLLSENDKNGYRNVTGGSHLTWVDMFSKTFLKGFHRRKGPPPVVYNVKFLKSGRNVILCYSCTERCEGYVYVARDDRGDKIKPWKWLLRQPSPSPPNCSIKSDVHYTFDAAIKLALEATDRLWFTPVMSRGRAKGYWLMVVIEGGKDEDVLFRTGAWYLVN